MILRMCVESTVVPSTPSTSASDAPTQASGSGVVSATSSGTAGGLPTVDGSVPLGWFEACSADFAEQVRLVDGIGVTWTFGWDLEGSTVEAGSADGFTVGESIDWFARSELGNPPVYTLLLADGVGPKLLIEQPENGLTEAQRGGVSVEVHHEDFCWVAMPYGDVQHFDVAFAWPGGGVDLRSGMTATVPASRSLDVTVVQSSWQSDCTDGCGLSQWTAWETPGSVRERGASPADGP